MAFFQMDFGSPEKSTESYFFGSVLMAAGQKHVRHADGIDNTSRACNYLVELSKPLKEKIIAVAFNEANRFTQRDYDHLVTLDNVLERCRKRLFAILIYQSDAENGGAQLMDSRPPSQLTGRFFSAAHEFTGLEWGKPDTPPPDLDGCDVTMAFHEFDVGVIHPDGPDGVPCTQWFAPNAYAKGYRLTKQVGLFRNEVEDFRVQHGLQAVAPWPMQTFDRFVYFLLVRIAGDDPNFREFSCDQVRAALRWSAYIELELSKAPVQNAPHK
jgi:hypothetical protein